MKYVEITFTDGHHEKVSSCVELARAVGRKAVFGYKDEGDSQLTYEQAWSHLGGMIEYTNTPSGFPEYYDENGNRIH